MRFGVRSGERDVAEFTAGPGVLSSVALLPPGARPATHPWVHGVSLDGAHEATLRDILLASEDLDAFVAGLRAAGYAVVFR